MELSEILKITKSCTGVCAGKDCPRYKHSNPTWCLAMNIKELLDTIESQKEHLEYKDEIYADLSESLRLANEANKDVAAKLKETGEGTNILKKEIKVGDTVYQTDGVRIYESAVKKVIYETTGIAFDDSAIGDTVFLSEEAALAERDKE